MDDVIGTAILCKKAKLASKNSYTPYSGFQVGAAVGTDKGVFQGCNIENASYGLTVCAERIAVFNAIANGAKKIKMIVIYNKKKIPYPCGACLQVLSEYAKGNTKIIIITDKKKETYTLSNLLPKVFKFY